MAKNITIHYRSYASNVNIEVSDPTYRKLFLYLNQYFQSLTTAEEVFFKWFLNVTMGREEGASRISFTKEMLRAVDSMDKKRQNMSPSLDQTKIDLILTRFFVSRQWYENRYILQTAYRSYVKKPFVVYGKTVSDCPLIICRMMDNQKNTISFWLFEPSKETLTWLNTYGGEKVDTNALRLGLKHTGTPETIQTTYKVVDYYTFN